MEHSSDADGTEEARVEKLTKLVEELSKWVLTFLSN